ncbi:MAG TPA: hypothetical protein VG458_07205 [Solirubrobacterales bacterium]|nr:hypothetical protein [Solirubrobacterales bacterium]
MTEVAAATPLIALEALSAAIWVGGLVAIFVVARAASRTLGPRERVAFFRTLGRSYGVVGSVSLLVALTCGALLLRGHPWDGLLIAAASVAGALVLATATGIAQARAMTRLRHRSMAEPSEAIEAQVRRGAILAGALRGTIALLTLALVVLGAALAA